jgi:hypothetical protein
MVIERFKRLGIEKVVASNNDLQLGCEGKPSNNRIITALALRLAAL